MKIHYLMFQFASAFLCSCNSQTKSVLVSENIVIVNAGVGSRVRMAKDIAYLNSLEPGVLAIDFQFSEKRDVYGDSLLSASLNECKNLVMAVAIKDYSNEFEDYSELIGTLPEFRVNAKVGFVNLLFEKDEFQTLRRFTSYEEVNGEVIYQFGIQTAMAFDTLKTVTFLKSKPKMIDVAYKGDESVFHTVSFEDLIRKRIPPEEIRGKIVVLGFIGLPGSGFDEDKFFSPLNDRKSPYKPDMYGSVFHANIIAQVLRDP
jgi:CHASE2 domain-containing sensor protein